MSGHAHLRSTAMVAGTAYGAGAVLELVRDQPTTFNSPLDYIIEATFVVGLAATVAVLVGLARGQQLIGSRIALLVGGTGNAALLVAASGTMALGREVLDGLFVLGILGILVGYFTMTILDLARRLTPRGTGAVLLLGFVGSMLVSGVLGALLDHSGDGGTAGGLALAAAWVAVGRLLSREPAVAPDLAQVDRS